VRRRPWWPPAQGLYHARSSAPTSSPRAPHQWSQGSLSAGAAAGRPLVPLAQPGCQKRERGPPPSSSRPRVPAPGQRSCADRRHAPQHQPRRRPRARDAAGARSARRRAGRKHPDGPGRARGLQRPAHPARLPRRLPRRPHRRHLPAPRQPRRWPRRALAGARRVARARALAGAAAARGDPRDRSQARALCRPPGRARPRAHRRRLARAQPQPCTQPRAQPGAQPCPQPGRQKGGEQPRCVLPVAGRLPEAPASRRPPFLDVSPARAPVCSAVLPAPGGQSERCRGDCRAHFAWNLPPPQPQPLTANGAAPPPRRTSPPSQQSPGPSENRRVSLVARSAEAALKIQQRSAAAATLVRTDSGGFVTKVGCGAGGTGAAGPEVWGWGRQEAPCGRGVCVWGGEGPRQRRWVRRREAGARAGAREQRGWHSKAIPTQPAAAELGRGRRTPNATLVPIPC
jgi:hypothetical protein